MGKVKSINDDDLKKFFEHEQSQKAIKESEGDRLALFSADSLYKPTEFVRHLVEKGMRKQAEIYLAGIVTSIILYSTKDIDDAIAFFNETNKIIKGNFEDADKRISK